MHSNKKRLYVALYPSGIVNNPERRYHWAFIVGPKVEDKPPVPGAKYHVKNRISPVTACHEWVFRKDSTEQHAVRPYSSGPHHLRQGQKREEPRQDLGGDPVIQGNPDWRSLTWIADVLRRLALDGKAMGTAELDWSKIEAVAREYVGNKTVVGRYDKDWVPSVPPPPPTKKIPSPPPRPTWDLLEQREVYL